VRPKTRESCIQAELYRNALHPLIGPVWGWWFPDVALTANTAKMHFSRLGAASIQYARWVVAWNPNTSSTPQQPNGIRLISFDFISGGQINGYNEMGTIQGNGGTTPAVADLDVTSQFQSLLASASDKHIGHTAAGDGVTGIKIYGSWIEIIWG
jgi:hypothetical protein